MTFRLPWEALRPGPIGEYLEVIDHDPISNCFYAPVDLDDPHLLARDGLAPSERTPQFHQQMVYAVAQNTIVHFEKALGRKVLWAPGPPPDDASEENDSYYVPRLRIYPHALRDANAYYSPPRKALLFGYFQASPEDPGEHMTGAMVFTCLSHDIVAHETAHALLDGMHRQFINASNPDVLAFHEGFADIVALLLHFCHPEIVRDQMARTRGRIRAEDNFLGALATEFGRTTGNRGALRNYIGARDPATGEWRPHVPRHRRLRHRRGAARARRHPGGRGVRRVPVHLREAHRRSDPHRHRRLGRAARGRPVARAGQAPGRRGGQGGRARPPHVHPRARLLPAVRHHLRRVPARRDLGRCRSGPGRRPRLPHRVRRRASACAPSTRAAWPACRRRACCGARPRPISTRPRRRCSPCWPRCATRPGSTSTSRAARSCSTGRARCAASCTTISRRCCAGRPARRTRSAWGSTRSTALRQARVRGARRALRQPGRSRWAAHHPVHRRAAAETSRSTTPIQKASSSRAG